MGRRTRTRAAAILATGAIAVVTASACTPDQATLAPAATRPDPITVEVWHWGNSGIFESETGPSLEAQYEGAHPWVDVVHVPCQWAPQPPYNCPGSWVR